MSFLVHFTNSPGQPFTVRARLAYVQAEVKQDCAPSWKRADRDNRFVRDIRVRTPIATDGRLDAAARHPGLSDPRYLPRRRSIASLARGHRVGDPSPRVDYTETEQQTWRTVHQRLRNAQREHACRAALDAREQAPVPAAHIPQHAEVGLHLRRLTGFDFTLAGGVVGNKRFLTSSMTSSVTGSTWPRRPSPTSTG